MTSRVPAFLAILAIALLGLFLTALQPSNAAVPTSPDPQRAGCGSPAAP
jgi:hypothetical protein